MREKQKPTETGRDRQTDRKTNRQAETKVGWRERGGGWGGGKSD